MSDLILDTSDNEIFPRIYIEDVNKYPLDVDSILNYFTIEKQEELTPVLTCSCGEFGCGGMYSKIEIVDETMILKNLYNAHDRSLFQEGTFVLYLDQLKDLIKERFQIGKGVTKAEMTKLQEADTWIEIRNIHEEYYTRLYEENLKKYPHLLGSSKRKGFKNTILSLLGMSAN